MAGSRDLPSTTPTCRRRRSRSNPKKVTEEHSRLGHRRCREQVAQVLRLHAPLAASLKSRRTGSNSSRIDPLPPCSQAYSRESPGTRFASDEAAQSSSLKRSSDRHSRSACQVPACREQSLHEFRCALPVMPAKHCYDLGPAGYRERLAADSALVGLPLCGYALTLSIIVVFLPRQPLAREASSRRSARLSEARVRESLRRSTKP